MYQMNIAICQTKKKQENKRHSTNPIYKLTINQHETFLKTEIQTQNDYFETMYCICLF